MNTLYNRGLDILLGGLGKYVNFIDIQSSLGTFLPTTRRNKRTVPYYFVRASRSTASSSLARGKDAGCADSYFVRLATIDVTETTT